MDVENVLRLKYATWNTRGLGEKEEELESDKILNENNINISVITERKRNCEGRKRLNSIRLFTVGWTDTPEANQKKLEYMECANKPCLHVDYFLETFNYHQ